MASTIGQIVVKNINIKPRFHNWCIPMSNCVLIQLSLHSSWKVSHLCNLFNRHIVYYYFNCVFQCQTTQINIRCLGSDCGKFCIG